MTIFIIIWVACAFIGGCIGQVRGRWGLGVVLGAVLGLIGVIIIAVVPRNYDALARREFRLRQRQELERQRIKAAVDRQAPR
jgi:hypothetical protein